MTGVGEIEVITTESQFLSLQPEWARLLSESQVDSVFSTFEWLYTWWQHFGRGKQLHVLTLRRHGCVVAIAPFVVLHHEGFRQAALMGGHLSDYKDFIIADSEDRCTILSQILRHLFDCRTIDFLQLKGLREDSPNFAPLRAMLELFREQRPAVFPYAVAPYVPVQGTWDEYWSRLDREFRRSSRQRMTRLAQGHGAVVFTNPTNGETVGQLVDQLIQTKIRNWHATSQAPMELENPAVQRFYSQVAQRLQTAGWLKMSVMSVGGHIAAIDLGMSFGGKYYGCQTTFNHEFELYSVGRLLALRILEDAFAEGLREVDMLVGNEPYKYQYRPQSRNLYSVALFQDSLPGHIAEGWFRRLRPRLAQSVRARKQPLPLASLTRWMRLRAE